MSTVIPERFRRAVLTHAICASVSDRYPLILAIQGPPGDGKTFQTMKVLKDSDFTVFTISSSLLSGSFEGESVKELRNLYLEAHAHQLQHRGSKPVLLLEDFDLSPAGQRGDTRYTVNSQLVSGFLMNLADDVANCGVRDVSRFPIFVTGNDFTGIHRPLLRPGRMEVFVWVPTKKERAEVVFSILERHVSDLTMDEAHKLAAAFQRMPVAAFAAAVNSCLADYVFADIMRTRTIDHGRAAEILNSGAGVDVDLIVEKLREREKAYLRPGKYIG